MKKLLKILAWLAGIFVVMMILIIIGLKLFLPAEKIRSLATEKASAALGRDVSIESIDISFWGGLGVKLVDVVIGNPDWIDAGDFVRADNIDVKLYLLPLISGEYRVDRLIINNPHIVMLKMPDGANNFTLAAVDKKLPPDMAEEIPAETKAAAVAVSFDRLEIRDGKLDYIDDSTGIKILLSGLHISTALESPRNGFYESSGKVTVDSLLLVTEETLPAFAVDFDYSAQYDLSEKHLMLDKADLTLNGLLFELKAEVYHQSGAIRGRGNVKSKRISVADLFRLMPPDQLELFSDFTLDGDFSLEIDLEYDDADEEPLQYSGMAVITDMGMSCKDIPGKLQFKRALIDFEPDNLRMNIENGSFDGKPLKGHLVVNNFKDPVISGELTGKLNLIFVQPFLPSEDGHELSGEMDFATRFSGSVNDIKTMQFSGEIAVVDGRYNSELVPEPVESFSLRVYFDNSLTRVDEFSLKTASGNLGFTGRINNLIPYLLADSINARKVAPSVDGTLDGQLNLGMLNRFLPQAGNPQLTGLLKLDLNLTGRATDLSNFRPRGRIAVSNASFHDSLLPEPIERFEAELRISPDTITIDNLTMAFVSSDLSLSGVLIDPFPYMLPLEIVDRTKVKKPRFVFDLSAHRFNIDKLFPEAAPGSATNRASLPVDSIPPLILPDIDGDGTFRFDSLVYSQVEFTSITGKVKIRDRKIDCHDVSGKAYTGTVAGQTSIDLSSFDNPHYVGEFHASQIEADDFVSRFSEFGGYLFGKIDINGNYDARGWEPDAFLNSLSMTGTINMKEGKLITSGSVHSTISSLASKAGQSFEKEQPLNNLTTNIIVKDGRVSTDKLTTSLANLGDFELAGSYGFDGSLDYKGSVLLSQAWTDKLLSQGNLAGGLAALFTDKSTPCIKLPLTITGTINKPSLNIDYTAMTKNIGESLKDDAAGLLKGLFKKK